MNTHVVAGAVAAAVLASSFLGCRTNEETSTTHTTSAPTATEVQKQAEPAMSAAQKMMLTSEDKDFITKQAQERMEEVAVGKEVQRKAASSDVKMLSEHMVNDNSRALDELKSLAEKKGVTLPTELDKERQADVDKLAVLTGKKLDKEYASEMVSEREDDVKAYREAQQKLHDADLKSWAATKVPVFEKQLSTAKDVKAKTKNE